jgi:hypothetical protein
MPCVHSTTHEVAVGDARVGEPDVGLMISWVNLGCGGGWMQSIGSVSVDDGVEGIVCHDL